MFCGLLLFVLCLGCFRFGLLSVFMICWYVLVTVGLLFGYCVGYGPMSLVLYWFCGCSLCFRCLVVCVYLLVCFVCAIGVLIRFAPWVCVVAVIVIFCYFCGR